MKKTLIYLTVITFLSCIALVVIINANQYETIQSTMVNHQVIINEVAIDSEISILSLEDRLYLPIRALCEILDIEIEWDEEKREVIIVNNSDKIRIVDYDDTWHYENLDMTKETAETIAEAFLLQFSGEKFMSETVSYTRELRDGKFYRITRMYEDTDGGCETVTIRKSDGKIVSIEYGE
jgi:hypothetical protein